MTPNAQIEVLISIDGADKKSVTITNNRPVQAAQLFVGKKVSEALRIIPLLFHVCGKAQGFAAVSAVEAALGQPADTESRLARQIVCDSELIREHLLRIFLDWSAFMPDEFKSSDRTAELQEVMSILPQFEQGLYNGAKPFNLSSRCDLNAETLRSALRKLEELLTRHIYGAPPALWLAAQSRDVIFHWMQNAKTLAGKSCGRIVQNNWAKAGALDPAAEPRFLPPLSAETLYPKLFGVTAERFIQQPTYRERALETSALSRHHFHPLLRILMQYCGTGLLTRQIARLVEVAVVFATLSESVERLLAGDADVPHCREAPASFERRRGLAMVDASRGVLVHAVELAGEVDNKCVTDDPVISCYRILAPTEWNFHASGPLVSALEAIEGRDEAHIRQMAEMLISSIDPCTGTKLEVHYA
ncbi:MAG: hydrogenase assembly protein HupF [Rhodomicrobium sp.]|nr:MAG: hydrogenase assembly protein HupF [Rhodomicrobium sp.]